MKKKNLKSGFSLVELLAVIVIVSLVITIVTVSVTSRIRASKEIGSNLTKENIIDSAILYTKEYNSLLNWQSDDEGKYYCVTVLELINSGYFTNSILDDNITKYTYVLVRKNNQIYTTSDLMNNNDADCIMNK